jgi:hypothetical protein
MSVKNSSDTIGSRTQDLPACSAVPEPIAYFVASVHKIVSLLRHPYAFQNLAMYCGTVLTNYDARLCFGF